MGPRDSALEVSTGRFANVLLTFCQRFATRQYGVAFPHHCPAASCTPAPFLGRAGHTGAPLWRWRQRRRLGCALACCSRCAPPFFTAQWGWAVLALATACLVLDIRHVAAAGCLAGCMLVLHELFLSSRKSNLAAELAGARKGDRPPPAGAAPTLGRRDRDGQLGRQARQAQARGHPPGCRAGETRQGCHGQAGQPEGEPLGRPRAQAGDAQGHTKK